jgi:YD repeat-containing protein
MRIKMPVGLTSVGLADCESSVQFLVTEVLDKVIRYQRDVIGNVTNRIDAMSRSTAYSFDALNRLTNIVHEGVWKASFKYDANGNMTNSHLPPVTLPMTP